MDCLEGFDGFIYITSKEELNDLIAKSCEEVCLDIERNNDNFDIDRYL